MKIFITGASGFVGGAIARRLAQTHEVYAMARSKGSAEKVVANGARPVTCSLGNLEASHLSEMDLVIHSAAYVEPWGPKKIFWETNVEGTRRLLEAAKIAGVKRFIHIGTEACLFYGQDMINADETWPYAYNSPFFYSQTKAASEKLVLEADAADFTTISIRPRMVWGPGDETIMKNLMEMVDSGAFRWLDGGKALTSTTHIENLVDGVELALEKGRGGEAYFVTDGQPHTVREFITLLLDTAGRTPTRKTIPGWFARSVAAILEFTWKLFGIQKKPPLPRFSAAVMSRSCTINIDKARKELGYEPRISVEDGMARLKAYNQANS